MRAVIDFGENVQGKAVVSLEQYVQGKDPVEKPAPNVQLSYAQSKTYSARILLDSLVAFNKTLTDQAQLDKMTYSQVAYQIELVRTALSNAKKTVEEAVHQANKADRDYWGCLYGLKCMFFGEKTTRLTGIIDHAETKLGATLTNYKEAVKYKKS